MAEFINTSYKQYYIVVSASADGVVLRPVEDAKLATYPKMSSRLFALRSCPQKS